MAQENILIVDDEIELCKVFSKVLERDGYNVSTANGGKEALARISVSQPDLLILDMKMPGMDGIQVLKRIKKLNEKLLVIILTAYGSIRNTVEAMKLGAYDYLTKPIDNKKIKAAIKSALRSQESSTILTARPVKCLLSNGASKTKIGFNKLIGNSPQMQRVYRLVKRVAAKDVSILLEGESGTGKELIARAIHYNSPRSNGPFVPIDCATLPEDLVESEIFGYEKGAFTGATNRKLGKFELANGGTLFLDEVGNLPFKIQVKLLRVLEERQIERLGGKDPIKIDVRIIAASNIDLEKATKRGKFREDLYHRLKVFPILLPPLRERKGDLHLLVKHFLEEFNLKHNNQIKSFSSSAMELLIRYQWSGNVRELKNTIESAVLLADDIILSKHLPLSIQTASDELRMCNDLKSGGGVSLKEMGKMSAQKVEKELIIRTLNQENWNKRRTAQILNIDYKTLYNKLKEYGIKRDGK